LAPSTAIVLVIIIVKVIEIIHLVVVLHGLQRVQLLLLLNELLSSLAISETLQVGKDVEHGVGARWEGSRPEKYRKHVGSIPFK